MVIASQLRTGMAIRLEGNLYKVLLADYHPGQGKMGGVTHARLRNLDTGTQWEHSFRSELKLEDVEVERQSLEFLYQDADGAHFMNPDTYEQYDLPVTMMGAEARFLTPQQKVGVEFVGSRPVDVLLPEFAEARVADTAPPAHQQGDSTWKRARLENGVEVQVPQFIKNGDLIRVDLAALRYMDRVRAAKPS